MPQLPLRLPQREPCSMREVRPLLCYSLSGRVGQCPAPPRPSHASHPKRRLRSYLSRSRDRYQPLTITSLRGNWRSVFDLISSPDKSEEFVQAENSIRDIGVTGVQTCALPI